MMPRNGEVQLNSSSAEIPVPILPTMPKNGDVQFKSSSIKLPVSSLNSNLSQEKFSITQFIDSFKFHKNPTKLHSFPPPLLCSSTLSLSRPIKLTQSKNAPISFSHLQFCFQSLTSNLSQAKFSITQFIDSIKLHKNPIKLSSFPSPLLCSSTLAQNRPDESTQTQPSGGGGAAVELAQPKASVSRTRREDEERVLISEVLVRSKDGEELERKDLELEALTALKACRPNSALTVGEVQEDVHRIIDSGYFSSCMPVAVDTRDGIRLVFQVEPNQEFRGLVCEGANVLPSKFVEDSFRDGYGKVVNIRRLDEVIESINGWYMERGLFGMVSGVEILSGGILRLQIAEAEVNDVSIRFLDRKTREPTVGKTKPETILRQLTTKKGQVYSLNQGKRDVETVLTMGIMDDVSIFPQPAGDTGKVDLVMNVVERVSGGFSAGGGISSGITSGPLSGLIGSFAYSHRNLFGKNQKVNVSLERGQIDSIFRMNYTVPWIEGDDKRTQRSITLQNSRTPGTLVHGNQPDNSNLTIARVTAGIEFSRPLKPKWTGTTGLTFQRAGARDEKGAPIIKDFYSNPLTASGNTHDNMLLAKGECAYTGDLGSSMMVFSIEQGLPILPEWLCFTRANARARTGVEVGPANLLFSLSGGHVVGKFSPHEAFAIGGTNSVRGYEEGAVGSGRSYVVGSGELSFPMFGPVDGALFADYGTDLGSGVSVPGDPAGARHKPGSGYGYGFGIRVESPLGPLRLEYAFNDQYTFDSRQAGRFHFGVGHRN